MNVLAGLVSENAAKYVRASAIVIDREVVMTTPVDTGRARSNWLVSLGSPKSGTREPYAPGDSGNSGPANAALQMQDAAATIGQYRIGQTIFITNNLPYIQRLNDGWSAQAPAGFVEQAVQAGRDYLRGKKLLSRS